jgi:hypothetical protein
MQRGGAAAASAPQLAGALVPYGGGGAGRPPLPPSRELQAEARAVRSGWAEVLEDSSKTFMPALH